MPKYFLVGTSNVFAYNKSTNDLIFTSKTMADTSVEVNVNSTEIRGGYGDVLQLLYFNGSSLTGSLTETQFNLGMIAANVGSNIVTGANVWFEESVAITSNSGTATKTPLKTPDSASAIYGWFTDIAGNTQRVTFSGSTFTTSGLTNQTGCLRYYVNDANTKEVTIPANFIPANVRLVMDGLLASSDTTDISGAYIIGRVEFEISSAQLQGNQSISMSSSGVSQTPLSFMALADNNGVSGCSGAGVYAKVRQIITNANWYDNVTSIFATPDPVALSAGAPTQQLTLWAVPTQGQIFQVPNLSDITITNSTPATATCSAGLLVTRVASGSTLLTFTITNRNTIKSTVSVTAT